MTSNQVQLIYQLPKLNYLVEGHAYPIYILGGDRFCDYFAGNPPPIQYTTDYTYRMMELSYQYGVRGFDISCRYNLIEGFQRLRDNFPDVVGIGNPNWRCGYKLDGIHLWDIKERIVATIAQRQRADGSNRPGELLAGSEVVRFEECRLNGSVDLLTDEEVSRICIDQDIWLSKLELLRDVTKFCLIGADYADWMCGLDRLDLLRWQVESVRKNGMVPVSVSHWAGLTLPLLDKEDFAAHWVYANRCQLQLQQGKAENAIRSAAKPVTAFKILSNIRLPAEIGSTMQWLSGLGVKSFIFGLEKPEHVQATLSHASAGLLHS